MAMTLRLYRFMLRMFLIEHTANRDWSMKIYPYTLVFLKILIIFGKAIQKFLALEEYLLSTDNISYKTQQKLTIFRETYDL